MPVGFFLFLDILIYHFNIYFIFFFQLTAASGLYRLSFSTSQSMKDWHDTINKARDYHTEAKPATATSEEVNYILSLLSPSLSIPLPLSLSLSLYPSLCKSLSIPLPLPLSLSIPLPLPLSLSLSLSFPFCRSLSLFFSIPLPVPFYSCPYYSLHFFPFSLLPRSLRGHNSHQSMVKQQMRHR